MADKNISDVDRFLVYFSGRVRSGQSSELSRLDVAAIRIYDEWLKNQPEVVGDE